jgi:hypothetical protein
MPEIIVPESAARGLIAETAGNPHLIYYRGAARIVTRRDWVNWYRHKGGLLIMTRDDLREVDPDALGYDPGFLAGLLTDYASNFGPS